MSCQLPQMFGSPCIRNSQCQNYCLGSNTCQ
jgi:hypothetical protein